MPLPTNWQNDVGMKANAAFLNLLGEEHNALLANKLQTWTQTEYDAIAVKDPDVVYIVVDD